MNDELYLHANADVTVVTRLDGENAALSPTRDGHRVPPRLIRATPPFVDPTVRSKEFRQKETEGPFPLDAVYADDRLVVTWRHLFHTLGSGGARGKNVALCAVPNRTHPHARPTRWTPR